jgi:hypothetical protein
MQAQATKTRKSLAQAIKQNIAAIAQPITQYKNNVVIVNTYVSNVMSSGLPNVNPKPKDWDGYTQAWEEASGDALTWVNRCMNRLLSVPQDVTSYNSVIAYLLNDAITQTNALIANPNNTAALAALNNDLIQIPQQLQAVETFISGAVQQLQNFQDVLPKMAAQLNNLSNLAISDNAANADQIAELQQQIQKLQDDINNLTASIIGFGVAGGAALTIGLVSSIVLFPVGLATWFVMGPAVLCAGYNIVLDGEQISNDKAQIDLLQGNMNQVTAACSVLATMSTTYGNLATQSQTIQTALSSVLQFWQDLSADVATAIADTQTAANDTNNANYQAVLDDLQAATTEWAAADAQAANLALDLQVNNAPLQIGMSSSQVSGALAEGATSPVITYFNNVGANALARQKRAAE